MAYYKLVRSRRLELPRAHHPQGPQRQRLPIPPRPHKSKNVVANVGNSKLFDLKQAYASIFPLNYQILC